MRGIKHLLLYLFLMVAGLFLLYPLFFTFSTSLMTPEESGLYPPKLLPSHLYLANFKESLETAPLVRFLLNSTAVSLIVTVGQLLTSSLAAYAFAFIPFKGRNLLFSLFLSTMMIPWEVAVIPNYLTIKSWGWLDSYQGLTVPFLASAFGTFLLRQSFLQLPKDLIEAAKIDGAGHLRIYAGIVLPIARPALATLGVYAFLTTWNMYLWPLLITNSETMRTVQIGVGMLQWQESTAWNLVLAGITIVLLPSLFVLLFGLKQLIQGLSAGALKG